MSFTPAQTFQPGDTIIMLDAPRRDIISNLLRFLGIANRTAPRAYRCTHSEPNKPGNMWVEQ